MKKVNILLLAILFATNIFAQNVGINADGTPPDASAMPDIKSTTKGILIPRMTVTQRIAMPSKTEGLMIYQTNDVKGFYYYDGVNWQLMTYFKDDGTQIVASPGDETGTENAKHIVLQAGSNTNVSTNTNGGNIILTPGTGQGTGANGNVGIGTTNPTASLTIQQKYDNLQSALKIISSIDPTKYLSLYNNGGTAVFQNTDAGYIALKEDGNVGIGTTNPLAKLEIIGNGSFITTKNANTGHTSFVLNETSNNPWFGMYNSTEEIKVTLNTNGNSLFNGGNVGINTGIANYMLDVNGDVNVHAGHHFLTAGADYAEYFENEAILLAGDIVGVNLATGKVRKYQIGDKLAGVVSDDAGYVGNNRVGRKDDKNYSLIGLSGQLKFDKTQVTIENRIVKTLDNIEIGVLLSNGNVFIK